MLDQNEIELFRDNVKKFLENEVAPYYNQWEKDEKFPRELWNKMGENGLLCVDVPEEYGGFGATFTLSAVMAGIAGALYVPQKSRNRPGCRKWFPAKPSALSA